MVLDTGTGLVVYAIASKATCIYANRLELPNEKKTAL